MSPHPPRTHSPAQAPGLVIHGTFPATPDAPARARELLRALLGDDPRSGAAQLAASELVTNALRHAGLHHGDRVEVDVHRATTRLRVAVLDPGHGFDAATTPAGPGGWGFVIVDGITVAWGIDRVDDQTIVWFEL